MLGDQNKTCLGLEYFCFEGDGLWMMDNKDLIELAKKEISAIGLVQYDKVEDGTVIRMPKAYPVYDDDYEKNVMVVRKFVEQHLPNLYLVGRNGMHKYNNQDHAMMTALLAARNIMGEKHDVWKVNSDAEYHEEEKAGEEEATQSEKVAKDGVMERLVPRRVRETEVSELNPKDSKTTAKETNKP